MRVDRMVDTPRERSDRLLEPLVLERRHASAAIADEVMMVLAARVRGLVARRAVAHVEPLHEAELVQQVEGR
jgi:hypothetical protein